MVDRALGAAVLLAIGVVDCLIDPVSDVSEADVFVDASCFDSAFVSVLHPAKPTASGSPDRADVDVIVAPDDPDSHRAAQRAIALPGRYAQLLRSADLVPTRRLSIPSSGSSSVGPRGFLRARVPRNRRQHRIFARETESWYRFGTGRIVRSVQCVPGRGHKGRMGRVRTHMALVSSGWGPSGRRFKSGLPDLVSGSDRSRQEAVGRALRCADSDARWMDCDGALRWLTLAEQLDVTLPPAHVKKRRRCSSEIGAAPERGIRGLPPAWIIPARTRS